MMFELKSLSPDAIPAALQKAERYRLLNEPEQAQSICEDVLAIDGEHQEALRTLILALTDRFAEARPASPDQARQLLPRLKSDYQRAYYAGIIAEREGIAWLRSNKPRNGEAAYVCFRDAMAHFEAAEKLRPPVNDDALLRWNSCARMIMTYGDVAPMDESARQTPELGD
jgi:hypothetical protein